MKIGKDLFEIAQSATSAADLAAKFEAMGHKVSIEKAEEFFASVQQVELDPEDLDIVSGGCSSDLSDYDGRQCPCGSTNTTCTGFHGYAGNYQYSYHCNDCNNDFHI